MKVWYFLRSPCSTLCAIGTPQLARRKLISPTSARASFCNQSLAVLFVAIRMTLVINRYMKKVGVAIAIYGAHVSIHENGVILSGARLGLKDQN